MEFVSTQDKIDTSTAAGNARGRKDGRAKFNQQKLNQAIAQFHQSA